MPFFWSDQVRHPDPVRRPAGPHGDDDTVQVVAGDLAERKFVALYGHGGRLRGVLGVNMPAGHALPGAAAGRATWDDAVALAAAAAKLSHQLRSSH